MDGKNLNLKNWAEAHIFFNMYLSQETNTSDTSNQELKWRKWAIHETPNGKLLLKNSLFDALKNSSKIYLFHVTPNLRKILESGTIYSSGGCLVGSIYATPLFPENGLLKTHNLGQYIFKKEAPKTSYLKEKRKKSSIIIIEVDLPPRAHDNLIGIDYIKLGGVHLAIYKELEYLLSYRERIVLQEILLNKIKQSLCLFNFINHISDKKCEDGFDDDTFFELFVSAIDHLPILGYIYFEIISEYLMLFQDGKDAKIDYEFGEFHNAGYKNVMFDLFPELLKGSGLGYFKPTIDQLITYIKGKKLISNFDEKEFINYLKERIIFIVKTRLLNPGAESINWGSFQWDFKSLEAVASPLLGHLVHRELRNFGRFPDFYFYFDQFKALQAWNYWNHMGVIIPFNGTFPKGEVGINPAWPDLKIKTYVGKEVHRTNKNTMYVVPEKEISIKLVPRLVDHRITIMRSGGKKKMEDILGTFRD